MRITFCGTGSGAFTAERASSGIIVQHNGRTVMLDCGPGSVRGAMQAGITPGQIKAVLISHLHLDHVLDLSALVFQQVFGGGSLPTVYGPVGIGAITGAAAGFVGATARPRPALLPAAIEFSGDDDREICGFKVRSAETPHAPSVIGNIRRLSQNGTAIVYTGDTQANPGTIVPLAEGADVLIHECYDGEDLSRYVATLPAERAERVYHAITSSHTEVMDAAAIARDAGARRLALTHIPSYADPARLRERAARVFSGEIVIAHDGLIMQV
jgi:ribonuclease BN (tRNA processing enzyme)